MKKNMFRRQFLLGDRYLKKFDNWGHFKIEANLFLSAHPDLEVNQITKGDKTFTTTLIGYIINPYEPSKTTCEILADLTNKSTSFDDIQKNTYHLSGRWVIIYKRKEEIKLFHDPCGMRQVFYTSINNETFCGSQPTILNEVIETKIDTDPSIKEFVDSKQYEISERKWIGDGTIYKNVKHLLPNHYLDLKKGVVERYWINEEDFDNPNIQTVVQKVAPIFEGSIEAMTKRHKSMLAVTAGWDSRVLLAASKNVKSELKYFVSTKNVLKDNHMDIDIPTKLSEKLGLNLEVIENLPALREDFMELLKHNVSQARAIPKTLTIQYHFDNSDRIHINGNASEIIRSSFYGDKHPKNVDTDYITNLLNYKSNEYVKKSVQEWLNHAKKNSLTNEIQLMDLFYWEQDMGNWGAMYQAEQDTAIEEFSPFNNRKVLMLLLSVEKKYRSSPNYVVYHKLIELLWKETLSEPINPLNLKDKIKKYIPNILKVKIRNVLSNKTM